MMKLLAGGAVAALVIAVTPVIAQTAPPPPPGVAQGTAPVAPVPPVPPAPQMRERMHMMMMSDRTMTRDEVVRHIRDMFAKFDTNKDGYVTREELEAFHSRFAGMGWDVHKRLEEHGMMMGDRGAMFDRLDTNHDGMISRQEFMAAQPMVHREQRVMIMRNGEGSGAGMPGMEGMHGMDMGEHEMGMHGKAMHAMGMHGMGMGGRLFEMADANRDGRVSLQEAENAALQHFDLADLNHDGRLTPDEMRQAHEMMRREHRPS
jgi:Ca2+-binding EF-hand superfamily protein